MSNDNDNLNRLTAIAAKRGISVDEALQILEGSHKYHSVALKSGKGGPQSAPPKLTHSAAPGVN